MTIPEMLARHPWMEEPLRAYYHALPGLLADRTSGKFVVVKGDKVYDTWDTFRDANQFACQLFEPGTFLIQRLDPRLLEPLAAVFGPAPAEAPACPS